MIDVILTFAAQLAGATLIAAWVKADMDGRRKSPSVDGFTACDRRMMEMS